MFSIEIDTNQMNKGLSQLLKNAQSKRKMMVGISTEMVSLTEDNFAAEAFGNKKWLKSHRSQNGQGKTLQDDGQLAASITTRVGDDFARLGSNKVYAAIHHVGGVIKTKNKSFLTFYMGNKFVKTKQVTIPERPYLPINKDGELQNGAENRLLEIAINALSKNI